MANHGGLVRRRRAAASVLLATHITACTRWRVETVSPARLPQTKGPAGNRRHPGGHSTVVLTAPRVAANSLQGWSHDAHLSIPMTDIQAIATRQRDAVETTLLATGVAGAVAISVVVPWACISSGRPLSSC